MAKLEQTKKYLNYLFLNTDPSSAAGSETWARVGKSTEFTDTMNPTSTTYDYIEDSSPSDTLENYKPTTSMPLTAYVGDPIFEYVFGLYSKQETGAQANTKAMRVWQVKNTDGKNIAQQTDVLITIDNYNIATGVITFNIAQKGTPTLGTAAVVESSDTDGNRIWTPTFTADTATAPAE